MDEDALLQQALAMSMQGAWAGPTQLAPCRKAVHEDVLLQQAQMMQAAAQKFIACRSSCTGLAFTVVCVISFPFLLPCSLHCPTLSDLVYSGSQ